MTGLINADLKPEIEGPVWLSANSSLFRRISIVR